MAQVSYNHQQQQQQTLIRNPNSPFPNQNNTLNNDSDEEIDFYPLRFNPTSPLNTPFFPPIRNPNRPFSDTDSNPDSIRFSGEDSDSDQLNFVTDLFSTNEQYPDPNSSSFDPDREFCHDLGFELGHGNVTQLAHSSVTSGFDSSIGGLRVVGFESDSDSDRFFRDDESFGDPNLPHFWEGIGFEGQRGDFEVQRGDFDGDLEWEEVGDQRVLERDPMGSVIERIEELSVSSEISNLEREDVGDGVEEGGDRDLEWEFLLAVNNLERNLEFENESFGEYDEIFGQLMQNGAGNKGSPPTAKSFVENLPVVVLSDKELKEDNVVCAVCKDDLLEKDGSVTRLPCCHFYHEECIVPWLCIRNTCPVCRYELPTDDLEYERKKGGQEGEVGFSQELLVRYAFEPIF